MYYNQVEKILKKKFGKDIKKIIMKFNSHLLADNIKTEIFDKLLKEKDFKFNNNIYKFHLFSIKIKLLDYKNNKKKYIICTYKSKENINTIGKNLLIGCYKLINIY